MSKQIYRKSLLEKLSSPEQLDKMIVITSPAFWVALASGAVIVIVALVWSIFGSLPIKAEATGFYVPTEGTHTQIMATEMVGIVKTVNKETGDHVKKGEVMFTLDKEAIQKELDKLNERRADVESVTLSSRNDPETTDTQELLNIKAQRGTSGTEASQNSIMLNKTKSQLNSVKSKVKDTKAQMDSISAQMSGLNQGSAEYENLAATYNNLNTTYANLCQQQASLEQSVANLETQLEAAKYSGSVQSGAYAKQFNAAKGAILDAMDKEIENYNNALGMADVKAEVTGTISDMKVSPGSIVGQGTEMVTIREAGDNHGAIECFIPITQGKQVKEGMRVIVKPTVINEQEYGHMEGTVVELDDYVATQTSIKDVMGEDSLVNAIMQSGPVIGVTCKLKVDSNTASGYHWSSKKGSEVIIPYGTPVIVDVITDEKAPISMIIPFLKEKLTNVAEPEKNDASAGAESGTNGGAQ